VRRIPIYGHTVYPESLCDALIGWLDKRHGWTVQREWIVLCPGVVPSLNASIFALTQPDDAVIVQPPVYAPFLSAPKIARRRLLLNPLKFQYDRYCFELDHLERPRGDTLLHPARQAGKCFDANAARSLQHVHFDKASDRHSFPGCCASGRQHTAQHATKLIA
jgi:bifunctional pyridoxal-dependent enzyme with beta-cystathionase and maltose regulon repressor activities